MSQEWPFADPKNVAVLSLRRIVLGHAPILKVTHDEGDGTWQFLDGGEVDLSQAMLVRLENIVKLDPTVLELAELPFGWRATHGSLKDHWKRELEDV